MYIGIDNGKDGAIVVMRTDGAIVAKHKTPLIKASSKGGKKAGKDEYDIPAMRDIMREYADRSTCFIEKAQPMPMVMGGVVANYQRGFSYGLWQGILVTLGIPYEVYAPRSWQKVMLSGINTEDTKQAALIAAQRLWPNEDWRRSDKCKNADDGFVDAALICEFGRRIRAGQMIP